MKIIINPVWSVVDSNIPLCRKLLQFKYLAYRKAEYGGSHEEWTKQCMDKDGVFLTGLVPKLVRQLKTRNITVEYEVVKTAPTGIEPKLKVKKLYDYQLDAVKSAIARKRGVIHSSTGSGKTVIAMGIISAYPKHNILFIVPTIDLMTQTYREFVKEFDEMEVGIIGDGVFEPSRITVGIINSLYNHRLGNDYLHGLGITLVDECHRVSKLDGIYSKTLQQIPATIRIGLTATLPADTEAVYALEGNLGPVIYSVDRQGLTDTGRLAVPKIRILQIPIDADVSNLKKYSDVYSEGVVNSHKRNGIIIDEIAKYVLEGRTCLVIVRLLEHGQNLFDMIKMRYPKIRAYYAHGTTESEERERIRQELQARNMDVAITSTIWKEGVDIPSLNVVVNAAGSKSELFCLQVVGRGMRAAPGKDEFIILDFFDPSHHFLVSHFGYRIAMYFAQNWIKT